MVQFGGIRKTKADNSGTDNSTESSPRASHNKRDAFIDYFYGEHFFETKRHQGVKA